ncbi:hypothetical protein PVAND_011454 [Polypedilum vanderplanki]|uniref:Chitin-binding type-2 domain-containing protein n=1 Tax=Polypedilum vanderplanki TaxID=319348 RepID=A0A9J6CJI6_POLVA|nr:hypothetical protein PVAND_011454 [Polypedilum vanderplanki]
MNSSIKFLFFVIFTISLVKKSSPVCVLESDFGFSLNCNFKNSGLFRVRNLGGVKAHFGLGFSVGDELGFPESLGNVEGSKKRSANDDGMKSVARSIVDEPLNMHGVLSQQPAPPQSKATNLGLVSMQPVTSNPRYAPHPMVSNQQMITSQPFSSNSRFITANSRMIISPPAVGLETPKMTEAKAIPLGVPRFKKLPQDPKHSIYAKNSAYGANQIPTFQKLPPFLPKNYDIALEPETQASDSIPRVDLKGHSIEELAAMANVSVETIKAAIKLRQQQMIKEKNQPVTTATTILTPITKRVSSTSISTTSISTTPNLQRIEDVTEVVEIVNTPSTEIIKKSSPPIVKYKKPHYKMTSNTNYKVMNAPKEYYPAGYDKNFDDDFKSKIELPATSFHCGDQKHFPGLYADDDLGCMVFHVCALTDDGLVMKSFLCPESTLFDQTILKCNWWFYTDCKSSKSLYDH